MAKPSSDAITKVGKRLRRERKRQGLSLDEAAKLANLPLEHLRESRRAIPGRTESAGSGLPSPPWIASQRCTASGSA